MTRRKLLRALDLPAVEAAIGRAERAAAIELRVSIAGPFWGDPQRVAERAFARLGMTGTAGRSGLLLLLCPWRRQVVLRADEGITARVQPALWQGTVDRLTSDFREGRYTEGLVRAIDALGAALAPHLPPRPDDRNELADAVDR